MKLLKTSLLALSGLLLASAPAAAAPAPRGPAPKIHITGTAYAFDNQLPIAGATIRVAELPGARATTAADGTYDLVVPDGARITPYIRAAGFHGIYLQTFVAAGRNLRRVNFQVPSVGIYHALAAVLGVDLDANDNPKRCVVVSTFSTVGVRDLSFADFIAYGAHGVAGATASASPALPDPIYFNSSVIPDVTLTESSVDGGVVWLDIPGGVYRFSADHPSARFSSFVATCKPGRLVNANPPQGLYQLKPGERPDKRVDASIASAGLLGAGNGAQTLRLKIRSGEYVLTGVEVLRRGKVIARARPGEPVRYRRGSRTIRLPLHHRLGGGAGTLRVTFTDAAGNSRVLKRALLPAA